MKARSHHPHPDRRLESIARFTIPTLWMGLNGISPFGVVDSSIGPKAEGVESSRLNQDWTKTRPLPTSTKTETNVKHQINIIYMIINHDYIVFLHFEAYNINLGRPIFVKDGMIA